MSALNWALLSATAQPLALPAEKFVLAPIQHVALSLVPTVPGQPLQAKLPSGPQPHERTATGTLHVSNQRLVFVGPPGAIHTLSIPYSALHDGRFVQPIFSSSYYEGLILPAREGGLDVPQVLRFKFNEGGGAALFETVNEMKARIGASGGRAMPEPLPVYEPPPPPMPSSASASNVASPLSPIPSDEELAAAAVARRAEEDERESSVDRAFGGRASRPDSPPGYEMTSRN